MTENFGTVAWLCKCDTYGDKKEGEDVCALELEECGVCRTKIPPELAKLMRNGHDFTPKDVTLERDTPRVSVEVLEVTDTPLGPGWYWYKHTPLFDACCIEVGLDNTGLIAMWKGVQVDIKQLEGKWQRVCPSAFHLPKVDDAKTS